MEALAAILVLLAAVAWLWLRRRRAGTVATTREGPALGSLLRRAWSGLGEETSSRIEEALLAADLGVGATADLMETLRTARPADAEEAIRVLSERLRSELSARSRGLSLAGDPAVVLVVGVNGSGKTTSVAKIAAMLAGRGRRPLLGAADTFRAAAVAQLETWGDRLGFPVVSGAEGSDPAAVAYQAVAQARKSGADVVVIDTAGRLHEKANLMAELGKIHKVAAGERGQVDEVLLVLDATSGQSGIAQVRRFSETIPVTGIVLAKMDGTARGGIVVSVERELGVPVKLVGTGEGPLDLEPFDADRFVADLLEVS